MARAPQDISSVVTFVKGLVTEASPVVEVQNAATDMDNVVVSTTGATSRRLGLDFEVNHEQRAYTVAPFETNEHALGEWSNVAGNPERKFLVVQVGRDLHFYSAGTATVSDSFVGLVYMADIAIDPSNFATNPCDFTSINGGLVVTNKYCEPIYFEFEVETEKILYTKLKITQRDFDGLPDGLKVDERMSTLNPIHYYNLLNQGWIDPGYSTLPDYSGNGGGNPHGGGRVIDKDNEIEQIP